MSVFVGAAELRGGKLTVTSRTALLAWAQAQKDGPYTVTIERKHAIRNLEQNALYWSGFVHPLSEFTGYTPNEIHEYLKARFLPQQKRRARVIELVSKRTGEVLDTYQIDLSTTTRLNKVEFSEYLLAIGVFAETLGCSVGSNREAA